MELINATRMFAGYTMGVEPSGRESLVVVIKGTFVLPRPGETVRLHDEQVPLLMADTFIGAPGFSAPLHEADFAPRKNRCDVLLAGSAYAPGGRPVTRTHVGLHVGPMRKSFDVVGDRVWEASLGAVRASLPATRRPAPTARPRSHKPNPRRSSRPAGRRAPAPRNTPRCARVRAGRSRRRTLSAARARARATAPRRCRPPCRSRR